MRKTSNKKIFICKQIDVDEKAFKDDLTLLIKLAKENKAPEVKEQLHLMIPTYKQEPRID